MALADPANMSMRRLVSHIREAAMQWRVEHEPFWVVAFGRLWELRDEVGLRHAARLLVAFSRLRYVDLECIDHCEDLLRNAEAEELLGLGEAELAAAAVALGEMRRPEAMSDLLRPLTSRVHRLLGRDAFLMLRLLRVAERVGCEALAELADATARSLVEWKRSDNASLAFASDDNSDAVHLQKELSAGLLMDFIEALVVISPGGRSGSASPVGLDLLFRHATSRAKAQPLEFGSTCLLRLADAAQKVGRTTPSLEKLVSAAKVDS